MPAIARTSHVFLRTVAIAAALVCGLVSPVAGSALADAVMRGDPAEVDRLLAQGAPADAVQPDGSTALHWAAHRGDERLAARLIAAGARVDAATDTGITPMFLACERGSLPVVRQLLDAGVDPAAASGRGWSPLMVAARTGNVAVMALLLDRGAPVDAREPLRGTTALMWAAANRNTDAVRLLLARGADATLRSATVAPGRRPYLAPPGRERLEEFIGGKGLLAPVGVDTPEEQRRLEAEIAATRREVSKFPDPAPYARRPAREFGGLTPLLFAVRANDQDTAKLLVEAGADVNQTSEYGWSPLLVATHNRDYRLGAWLLSQGADPDIANEGGWNALYLATDNRNIEGGDYPTRRPDMDSLGYIRMLLDHGADPDLRMASSTETRTIFTHQWLYEEGATPFLRAAQSGDLPLMKLLLERGADPGIATDHNVTPLMVASGIGWVEGVTFEWSPGQTLDAVKLLLELGAEVNARDTIDGRTALMGAAHKGREDVVELLVAHGADLAIRDIGSRDSVYALAGVTWQAIDYADGLVRVGVQSSVAHPGTAALLRRLMQQRNLAVPPEGRTLESICITELCR